MNNHKNVEYKCPNCKYTNYGIAFRPVSNIHERLDAGDVYTDKECPRCRCLSYPITAIETADNFKQQATDLLKTLTALANESLVSDVPTAGECQLTGLRVAMQEVGTLISGVVDSDITTVIPKLNINTSLGAVFAYHDILGIGRFSSEFESAVENTGWEIFSESGIYSEVKCNLQRDIDSINLVKSMSINLVFDWDTPKLCLEFHAKLDDEVIGFHTSIINHVSAKNEGSLIFNDDLKTLMVDAYSEDISKIGVESKALNEDVVSAIERIATILT
ncbi:hypothetical protein [Moritella sp. F3]|uniref:hypothetical protein n=1 Tax=Moritella sp. F3 TaxID=2718882 RepID=UPI0018E0FF88|nr:hypothetical protein [Moritella sp. F3]GIC77085.1 hypothetical protein FMO001_18120 [Moritella sp. F1]GIC82204.1 hypothetical protein FMO003_24850 [Moritella sp. F3]